MNNTTNTASRGMETAQSDDNFLQRIEHIPAQIIDAITKKSSVASKIVKSVPVQQAVAYEATHGEQQIAGNYPGGSDVRLRVAG